MTIEIIEDVVRNTVTRITRKDISQFTRTTTFKDLEADSLDIVQILVALEDHFDIEVVDEELESITNMGDFIDYINRKVAEKTARSA
ncbi:MAG TPA: acyl carrier protein [Dehalococcoidia bacterium]|jgi:acyl carrier protein|nr:acyl carrier protein [Dehalococcoidia bacterium]